MSLLTNETFKFTKLNSDTFYWGLLLLAFSSTIGALIVLTRLWDFRLTAQIARGGNDPDKRKVAVSLGRISWFLFHVQVISFAFGIERLGRSIFDAYAYRLI